MLRNNDILAYLKESLPRYKREYGVRRIGVFGSFARDEEVDANDIDIIVDMEAPTFDKYMDLKFELEDKFHKPVDLVLSETVKKPLKSTIERDTVYA